MSKLIFPASLLGVSLVLTMISTMIGDVRLPESITRSPKLKCTIVLENRIATSPWGFDAKFELTNISRKPVVLEWTTHVLFEYLSLDVWDEKGRPIPKASPLYSDLFFAGQVEKNLNRFEPGETQRMGICLFAQIHEETHPITVGKYTIQAAYKWDGQEYRSNKVMVEIVPK